MFEKFGWKQAKKSVSQSKKKRKKSPPPGYSVLLGQKKLPKGDNQVHFR